MASAKTLPASSELTPAGYRPAADSEFEAVFRTHYASVFGVLLRVTGSAEEAEDLTQEVFFRLHQHRGELEPERVGGWLYRVALNAGFNAVRSRRRAFQRLLRWARLEPGLQRGVAGPEEDVAARDEARLVRQALSGLRERDQAILALRYSGVSYAEIAAAVGVKPGSVGTLLARAERQLRERYEALMPEPGKDDRDET